MAHLSRASRSDILTTGGLPPHRRYGRSGCVGGAWETTDSRHEDFRDYRLKLGSIPEMIGLTRLDFNFLTFQTPGFWSHSCCILTSISPWEDLFSSPIFSLRGQFPNWAVLCPALEGGWTLMDLKPPENRVVIVEVKVFFSCKSGEIYVWHMWHMTLWDSDIAVLQTPVLDIYHGVLLPWFHTRDQEKNATMGASDCQPIILWHSGDSGGCVRFSSTLKLDGGQDLWVWVPWSLDLWLFNVISVTSHPHFFIPSMVTSDFRMA